MSIAFTVSGVRTVIPGVYDSFFVADSLPAPAPAGRSVMIFGEAEEGVPGADLDLRLNFYTNLQDVKEFYKSGPIVDAARQLFSKQPANVFNGSIQRLYVYKTNNSTRAERDLEGPAGYGALLAARFGEEGNLIKTKVVDAQSETKPTKTFGYLPSPSARSFRVMANGQRNDALAVLADGVGSDFVTALTGLTGVTVTGGTNRTVLSGAPSVTLTLTASGDTLTLTKSAGVATFDTASLAVGDIAYIPSGSTIAGGGDENVGAYRVMSVTASALVLSQLKSEVNAVAFDLAGAPVLTVATINDELRANAPVTVSITGTTPTGTAASLELLEDAANKLGAGMMLDTSSFGDLLGNSTSTVANIAVTVPSAGKLTLTLDSGSWTTTPKVGDLIRIGRSSVVAGATLKNVGYMIVESAGAQTLTASHLFSGMTTEAVASVSLAGANDTVRHAASFVSTSVAARRLDSSAERKVRIEASRESDGASLGDNSVGGRTAFTIGYFQSAATACTLSISTQRVMTITPTGAGSVLTVNTKKYKSLQELATFLNTQSGIECSVPAAFKSVSPSVLDMVQNMDIMDGHAVHAFNGKIKRDYNDMLTFFNDNFGLLAFRAGSMSILSGLPDAEALPSFLSGATLGSTNSASIQAALDAALKVSVRQVVPLFSRDATKDINDELTDPNSSYDIESIHAACKSHVSTASSTLFRKERFAMLSFYGSFEDSKEKSREMSFERCQMTFQLHGATNADGEIQRFLPWMSACAIAAARSQAVLGTSMLRKPFLLSSAEHLGDVSVYSDSLTPDFDPEDQGQLTEAIEAGLLVLNPVAGFGIRCESADNTTRSRENDPQAWVWERGSVLFVCDEVRQTVRTTLENFIGSRQTDVSTAVVEQAIKNVLSTFLPGTGNGSLVAARVLKVEKVGVNYKCELQIQPVEALEAITVDVLATREIG